MRKRIPTWSVLFIGLVIFATGAGMVASVVEVPYYAYEPGPVHELDQFITAGGDGQLDGEFLMLTVALHEVTAMEFGMAMLDPAVDLVRRERVRPVDISPEQYRENNLLAMNESKNTAIYVALQYLGYDVVIAGDGVLVAGVLEGTGAEGVLQEGDIISAIDGVPVTIATDATREISSHAIGDVLNLTLTRGPDTMDVSITLTEHTQEKGRPMVGFLATTHDWHYESSVAVDIDSENIGGPSAGLMYTLTIIDLLSPDDLLKGRVVAGTGTIDTSGNVGPIGGIRQKLVAAEREGATYAFVPAGNWEQAQSAPLDHLELIEVSTLQDALDFLATLS